MPINITGHFPPSLGAMQVAVNPVSKSGAAPLPPLPRTFTHTDTLDMGGGVQLKGLGGGGGTNHMCAEMADHVCVT
jgi:hypothetical protein